VFERCCRLKFPLLENESDATSGCRSLSLCQESKSAIFESGKPHSILPENAPTIGSAWNISPSN
jgi:hypothetical protein